MKRHVTLVGFMAAGKTTIGRHLARELGLPFIDTDELIVARHGPIPGIFAREGVEAFRAYEFGAAQTALEGVPSVVALGGGAVTHAPTRALVAERALRIYIEVALESILPRLRRARDERPLVGATVDAERLGALLAEREPLYREAEIVVRGARRSKSAFAREIAGLVRQSPHFTLANVVSIT